MSVKLKIMKKRNSNIKIENLNIPTIKNKRGDEVDRYYLATLRQYNLGYAILDELNENGELGRREIFYHTDENVAKLAFQDVIKGTFDVKKYPKVGSLSPQVIKFEEKHGDAYYLYTSREQFYKIFLQILTERAAEGWYYYETKKPKDIGLIEKEVLQIENVEFRDFQLKKLKKYQQELTAYLEEKAMQDSIKKAVKEKNGKLALQILNERRDGEYENFETIDLIEIE